MTKMTTPITNKRSRVLYRQKMYSFTNVNHNLVAIGPSS